MDIASIDLQEAQNTLAALQSDSVATQQQIKAAEADVEAKQAAFDRAEQNHNDAVALVTEYNNANTEYSNAEAAEATAAANLAASETTVLQEANTYQLEVCIPAGKTIPTDAENVAVTATISTSGSSSEMLKLASCTDIALFDETSTNVCTDITTGSEGVTRAIAVKDLTAGQCTSINLLTTDANDTQYQNTSFDIAYSSTDDSVRCEFNCLEDQSVTILNDDLINLLDTGLIKSVKNGFNKRWDTGGTPDSGYGLQDATQTDFYPDLSYTYIASNAKATQTDPGGEFCIQDNSTGLIWTGSIESNTSPGTYLIPYSGDDDITPPYCSISNEASGRVWQLPTVQELLSIMDLNPSSNTKPLTGSNLLSFQKDGTDFYNATSQYWSKDLCTVSTTDDGSWVVDFVTGHVDCSLQSSSNFKMHVYK